MNIQHTLKEVQKVVKSIDEFSHCVSNSLTVGWDSQVMEFKPFLYTISEEEDHDDLYFRLIRAEAGMKYVKEKYQKLFKQFKGLFINVEVRLTNQKMHDCTYLIRTTENYFSLFRLIQKQERKILSISFILRLLEFFDQILKVNRKLKVKINLNTSTILENDGTFKLADYKLLFHPNNLRIKDQNLESGLIIQMKYVIFDILSLKNWQNRQKFQEAYISLLAQLKHRRSQCSEIFAQIIENFFITGNIMTEQILDFKNKQRIVINESSLLESATTSSDISLPLLLKQQNSISEQNNWSTKPKMNRKRIWRLMLLILLLVVIGAFGLTYYFLTRDIDCGDFHYQQNRQCYRCPESCSSCTDGGQYSCTLCFNSYWLVMKSVTDKVGKCSTECIGLKNQSTMHCLVNN